MREWIWPVGVSIALVAIALSPVLREPHTDGFPLSTYPMFATPRATRQTLDYVIGATAAGERRALSPSVVGTGEVLQAYATIGDAIHGSKAELGALCTKIAVAVGDDARFADVATVRIVAGTQDAVDYLVDGTLGTERERASCRVMR